MPLKYAIESAFTNFNYLCHTFLPNHYKDKMHYCFIINAEPSKTGNADKIQDDINNLSTPIDYEIYRTTAEKTATAFVKEYCAGQPDKETCFVACGGDGTINEVATGIMVGAANKHLAVLAYGNGNDFIKYYEGKDFRSVKDLVNGTPHKIDILKVNDDRYSINVCNFGFDSVVASTANRLSRKGWSNPYRWGIVKAIFCGRFNRIQVKADGEELNPGKRMLLCTLGNNNHVGGEFLCSPRAKNDDGLIEVGYCKTATLVGFLGLLKLYTIGTHLDDPKASQKFIYRQSKSVDVHSDKQIELCLDGEMLPGNDFHIEIIPSAISFIIPA
jgi:diacylglycerol kinase family enzyme